MASWSELVEFVRSNHKIADEKPDSIKLIFNTGGLRSQLVFLWRQQLMNGSEEWVQIESPVGSVDAVDPRRVLEEVGRMVCGGAAIEGDLVLVRHSVPLVNLDINEFERPLMLVTSSADALEQKLVGADTF
jgi:transposase-like protein